MTTVITAKRSQIKSFLNTGTPAAPVYSIIGDGITTATINYNPKTLQQIFITEDTGHTEIESYMPNLPLEGVVKFGDAAFDFVDNLRKNRAVLTDAHTDIVNVWMYETAVAGAYPAEQQPVSIQIDDYGGDGGTVAKIKYTINYLGPAVQGTFNPTTLTFTANP